MARPALKIEPCPIEGSEPDGPLVIEPEVSRVAAAVVVGIAGVVFSLVPGIIVASMWSERGLSLGFLCPGIFLLFGLLIDALAVYLLLKCFNPKPVLALSHRHLYPGTEFEISWMFQGNAHALRKLTITLVGKEKVSYQQGTSTRTEESPFYRHVIVDTDDPNRIPKGFDLVCLPSDAMHSFKSNNNEILWVVQTHGDVAWWPDVDDAFPIRVLTLPVEETRDA